MLNIKEDILKNADIQTFDGPHGLPWYLFPCGSQWGPTTVWFFRILQNILFCVQHNANLYSFGTT